MNGDEPAPRLVPVTTQLLVLMPIRLVLALAGLAAAALVGEPAPAAVAFALGALGAAIALGADPRCDRAPPRLPALPRAAPGEPGVRRAALTI